MCLFRDFPLQSDDRRVPMLTHQLKSTLKIRWNKTTVGICSKSLTLVFQSQKESEFRRSQEEVIKLNRQMRDLSQVLHLGGGGSWSCFCLATAHQQWLNVVPGKRAVELVAHAGAHRHQCPALRAGQAKELVHRPEGAAPQVS